MCETKKKSKGQLLYVLSIAGFAAGICAALVFPALFDKIGFIGTIYVNLLKLIVIPLLMAEMCSAAAHSTGGVNAGRIIALFCVMFILTYLLTAVLVAAIAPGEGVNLFGDEWSGELASVSLADFFTSLFPSSIFTAMADGSLLPCLIFAYALGAAARRVSAGRLVEVADELRDTLRRLLDWIMYITPAGVFSLIGSAVAQHGSEIFGVCARYIATAWGCSAAALLLIMLLPACVAAHMSPLRYIKAMAKVWIVSLSTCSSAATLPTTIRVCNEDFGVSERITDMVVPLGCTIHMCGGAVSFCLLGLFTMQMQGVTPSLGMFLYMLLVATLMNMAAPGIPGGGIVLGATYLTILGAPTGFIGLYSGIYRLLDMAYTTLNVSGDVTANLILVRLERGTAERKR